MALPARVSRPYPLSPSPPASVSPPMSTAKPSSMPPSHSSNISWNERSNPETITDDSRFFSSHASSIGSAGSGGSSPHRWPAQPQKPTQTPSRQFPPTMFLSQDLSQDLHDPRLIAPAAERELHVVLPEPWMDASYVLQMARTQGWDIINVHMQPHGAVLVFASAAAAAHAFAQVNGSSEGVTWIGAGAPSRVQAHWAGAVDRANGEEMQPYLSSRPLSGSAGTVSAAKQIEYSIFVGDLAPETTNADLVAVFRNPLLGLRPDREPRVIRPFTSCRSAKIMVSPETGISKGYGFVRFTDEADQQRALIEMQGLYCLSRPMRLSHATAKTKPLTIAGYDQYPDQLETHRHDMYARMSLDVYGSGSGSGARHHSISGPDAAYYRTGDYAPPRSKSADVDEFFNAEGRTWGVDGGRTSGEGTRPGGSGDGARLEKARALLGALNTADPYNTTVFVGGLSGLIAEETLRGFFAPFGEIHYVKIPPGKGCGFVQFVRKADAERAIERMQGFPIGGGKIRLSWGRSQSDKAAQAATQAAHLGLNLGGLNLNSLSTVESNRLVQALEAIGYPSTPGGGLQTQTGGQSSRTFSSQQSSAFSSQSGSAFQGFQSSGFPGQQTGNFSSSSVPFQAPNPFQASTPFHQFSPTQSHTFQNIPSPSAQSSLTGQSLHSHFEPASAGLSRSYTASSFQPFSNELDLAPGYNRATTSRQSLAFEPESFGLASGRERQQTAPAHAVGVKNLNLGLAALNLNQRRELGIDSGSLSAPIHSNMPSPTTNKSSTTTDNNVYIR